MAITLTDIATVSGKNTQFPGHQIVRDFAGTLYAVTEDNSSNFLANVYTSTDGGDTWSLNAWETGIGNNQTSESWSQLLVDRLNDTVYLIRHDDAGSSNKGATLFRRDPDGEQWVDHGKIFGASATTKADMGRPTHLIDYSSRTVIGTTDPRTVSIIHFFYHRSRPDPDRLLYQNTLFSSGEENLDFTPTGTDRDKFIPAILPSGQPTVAAQKDETAGSDHIDFHFRTGDLDSTSGTWTEENTIFSTSTYTGQRLHDHIITPQGLTKVLFTANSDQVYIGERFGAGLWTVDQVMDSGSTPTMHSSGSFYGLLSSDWYGRLYVAFSSSSTQFEVWKRDVDGTWSEETSATSVSISAGLDRFYDHQYLSLAEEQIMVPGQGMLGTLWVGTTLKLFRGFDAAFTPQDEPEYECPTEPTRSSVVISDEGTSAGAFPDLKPDHTYSENDGYVTEQFRSVLGYVQTVARFATGRRKITVRYDALNETDKDTIRTFLNARKNNEEAFTWTLPDSGSTIKVALAENSVQYRKRAPDVYAVSFELVELLT